MKQHDWQDAIMAAGVSSNAVLVGLVLATHWPRIEPSVARVVKLSGLSKSSVLRAISELEDAGLVVVSRVTGRRSVYQPVSHRHRCQPETGVTQTPDRCHSDTTTGVTQTPKEPNKNQQDVRTNERTSSEAIEQEAKPTIRALRVLMDRHCPWWQHQTQGPGSIAIGRLHEVVESGASLSRCEALIESFADLGPDKCRYPAGALARAVQRKLIDHSEYLRRQPRQDFEVFVPRPPDDALEPLFPRGDK